MEGPREMREEGGRSKNARKGSWRGRIRGEKRGRYAEAAGRAESTQGKKIHSLPHETIGRSGSV